MDDQHSPHFQELLRRFPDLKPMNGTPTLFRINGIGATMCGNRDHDGDTNTYVKTHCFSFIFIPLLALGAYRVADAEGGGWYFLGRVPLSNFARTWNKVFPALVALLVLITMWSNHTDSPEYKARQELKAAQKLMEKGSYLAAAGKFRDLLNQPGVGAEARADLKNALEIGMNEGGDSAITSFKLLSTLPLVYLTSQPLIPEPLERGLKLAAQTGTANPENGLLLLDAIDRFAPTNATVAKMRQDFLLAATVKHPGELKYLEPLTLIYDEQGRTKEYVQLLEPYRTKLGKSECARLLGQYLVSESRYNDAYDLLFPYVQVHLSELHQAEYNYTNTSHRTYKLVLKELNDGKAPREFYDRYDKADKTTQDSMVDTYIQTSLRSDKSLQRALAEFRAANRIVPVTLDLGITQLNRAQGLEDPAARKAELEAAEKTFLAISTSAGESDEYRMFLGQVYYWLSRPLEGQKLFDALLAAHQRAAPLLLKLGDTYRDVGEDHLARQLMEEAYNTTKDSKLRHEAASARSRCQKDLDDMIFWLKKTDPESISDRATLNGAMAQKALSAGDRAEAIRQFQAAIVCYDKMDRNATTLNNCGLVYLSLFEASGKLDDYRRGVRMMEESIALNPSNAILLCNITSIMFSQAVLEVAGDKLRFEELGDAPDLKIFASLYRDETELAALLERLGKTETLKRFQGYLDRAQVLSPKTSWLYSMQLTLAGHSRDLASIKKLQQRIEAAQLDFSQKKKEKLERQSKEKNAENLKHLQDGLKRVNDLLKTASHPATKAYLSNYRDSLLMGAEAYGQKADLTALLENARQTHRTLDTSESLSHLQWVHFNLAAQRLATAQPRFAALRSQTRQFLGTRDLLVLVLDQGGSLANAIRSDSDALAAVEIEKERIRRFPSFPSTTRWSLLRHFDASLAADIRQKYQADAVAQLLQKVEQQLNPLDTDSMLELYWEKMLNGQTSDASAVYQKAIADGVRLPKLDELKL